MIVTLKVFNEEAARWRGEAIAAGLTLSAWIRMKCSETVIDVTDEVFPPTAPSGKPTMTYAQCEHLATAYNCKVWGCKFYEISNGRK